MPQCRVEDVNDESEHWIRNHSMKRTSRTNSQFQAMNHQKLSHYPIIRICLRGSRKQERRSDLLGIDNKFPVHDPLITYTEADNLGYDSQDATTSAAIDKTMVLGLHIHTRKSPYCSSAGRLRIPTWGAAEHPDCREPPVGVLECTFTAT